MALRVYLELPPRSSSRGPRYDVHLGTADGELLVRASLTPLLDAARILCGREQSGRIEMWDSEHPHARMSGAIETLAGLKVIENETEGPRLARWRPFPAVRGPPETADRPFGLVQPLPTPPTGFEPPSQRRPHRDTF